MKRKTENYKSYTFIALLSVQLLCPCFSDFVSDESPVNYSSDHSYEGLYSDPHRDAPGKRQDEFTLWQFKKFSNARNEEHRYPPPHLLPQVISNGWPEPTTYTRPRATERTQTKLHRFRLPNLSAIFNKHKSKGRGRGMRPGSRKPPHQSYAPSFISYGPIFGPPPMQQQNQWQQQTPQQQNQWQPQPQQHNEWQQQQQQQNQWQQQPQQQNQWQQQPQQQNQWQEQPQQPKRPTYSNTPVTATGSSSEYGVSPSPSPPTVQNYATPANRPHYGGGGFPAPTQITQLATYGTTAPTQAFTRPRPTYGPTVRINYRPPNQEWSAATTTRNPALNQGPWNPIPSSPPRRPAQNQWASPAPSRPPQVPNTYIPPTYGPPTGGYATPSSSYIPPKNNYNPNYAPTSPTPQYGTRSYEPPMHFGPPMHNFGPPKSSYGHPPPIIGDPEPDRYAPKDDIYRYPTGSSNSVKSPRHRYDSYDADRSVEDVDKKPSTDLYQIPRKPYRDPSSRKRKPRPKPKVEDEYYDYDDYSRSKTVEPNEERDHGQFPANGRPPPKYDTNYNSPGLSKDPKIVDWMPYSAKNYHEVPGKKTKAPKYRTLPARLRDHRPDPEHEKYPKLTYDTLISKRMSAVSQETETPSPPLLLPRNKSESEMKTEKEFNEMVQFHAKLVAIR